MQDLLGDVIEIGSFQGKSTFFLGLAVKYSSNGHLYCIDHFKGNPGKEKFYQIDKKNLSDLKGNFLRNIKKAFINKYCTLINQPSYIAHKKIKNKSVRLLFIDGNHTKNGITKDLQLFFPKLKKNAIIIFDDYDHKNFKDLFEVVQNFIKLKKIKKKYVINKTLIAKI